MKLIKKGPLMFQVRYKTLHMVPVEKFPFIILYHVEEAKKLVAVALWFSITPIISLILPNLGKEFYKFAVEFAMDSFITKAKL
jgi:hypothetical protein